MGPLIETYHLERKGDISDPGVSRIQAVEVPEYALWVLIAAREGNVTSGEKVRCTFTVVCVPVLGGIREQHFQIGPQDPGVVG